MDEKKPRGFALMDKARLKQIASQGGRTVHARGTGHQWTAEEARRASYARRNIRNGKATTEETADGPESV